MRVGMLTGGGDCPGLNAVIRAVVRKGERDYGDELVGFLDGWRGVIDGTTVPLDVEALRGTLPRGGTILGIVAHQPVQGRRRRRAGARPPSNGSGIDALVAIGGEDTLGVAGEALRPRACTSSACPRRSTTTCRPPSSPSASTPRCRSPPTPSTGCTPPPSRTTGCMVCEVMGRHAGHIAVWSGIAGGATMILIPEEPFDIEAVCDALIAPPRARATSPRSSSWPRARCPRRAR